MLVLQQITDATRYEACGHHTSYSSFQMPLETKDYKRKTVTTEAKEGSSPTPCRA